MNREIKFRAWDTTHHVMAEIDELDGDFDFIKDGDRVRSTIRWQDLFNGDYPDVIAMQFTGLKDKNGNDIYEGDLLKIRTPYRIAQIHTGNNIPLGRYEEPLEPGIKEEIEVVSFHGGCFVIGEPSLGELLCWRILPYDKVSAIEAWQCVDWEGQDGDLGYLLDWYKFPSEEVLISSLGAEVIGNQYENPELLKQ